MSGETAVEDLGWWGWGQTYGMWAMAGYLLPLGALKGLLAITDLGELFVLSLKLLCDATFKGKSENQNLKNVPTFWLISCLAMYLKGIIQNLNSASYCW